jgi:hypothetical protein
MKKKAVPEAGFLMRPEKKEKRTNDEEETARKEISYAGRR